MMLALKMGRTLEELGRMSSHEFELWLALYREDGWGDKQAFYRSGIVAATIANYAGKMRSAGEAPARPSDFMPYPADDLPEQEPDPLQFFEALARK